MTKELLSDRELAGMLGVSVSLVRKLVRRGPTRAGGLDIRGIPHVVVGDMRRWDAAAVRRCIGLEGPAIREEASHGV